MWTEENKEGDLIRGILIHGVDILDKCKVSFDLEKYISKVNKEHLDYPIPVNNIDSSNWFIPQKYKDLDIEKYLIEICPPENIERLKLELELYKSNNLLMLLKCMKYVVDILREHKIVWGVGRGSSVASYTLFLLGVHKIDSVKYNLPIEEFFKGE